GPRRGADLRYTLEIEFEQAAAGMETKIEIPRMETCGDCQGRRTEGGAMPETCPQCGGSGQVRSQQGFFSISRPCGRCGGEGAIITHPCRKCRGVGRVRSSREISVKIPAGVETGTRLRVSGEGEVGQNNGPRGDLYVIIRVKEHPFFDRDGTNIYCDVPISFTQAALGDKVEVPTLDGKETVDVKAGIQSGSIISLKGKGIPDLYGGTRGDQRIRIHVETPTRLNTKQKELLKEFSKISGEDIHPISQGFFEKVRSFFE
ncbi:MAG: molecular chaperone DnaJ, partial [bacterium]|nr:molecular chaperone DnaJ [bacterium]